jgi:hypothetical protein
VAERSPELGERLKIAPIDFAAIHWERHEAFRPRAPNFKLVDGPRAPFHGVPQLEEAHVFATGDAGIKPT